MHDTIPKGGGTDLPGLALINRECVVGTGTVCLAFKFVVKSEQLAFQIEEEAGNSGLEALTAGGGVCRKKQVLERDHPVP
jgi:hypothetical protein